MKVGAKRTATLLVAAMVWLGIVSCGDDTGSQESSAVTDSAALREAQTEVDRFLSNPPMEIQPLSAVPEGKIKVASVTCTLGSCKPGEFLKAAESLGWEATEETYDLAKGPADYVAAVRRALQSEPDALAMLMIYPRDIIKDELDQAREQGIALVDIGSGAAELGDGFISCVACKPGIGAYGKAEADFVAVDADGETEVGVVGDKTNASNIATTEALVEEFDRVGPAIEVHMVNASYAQTPQANAQAVVSAVQRNPNIEYLMFQGPDLLAGVPQALSAAGLADRVKVVAIDPTAAEHVKMVDGGGVYAWVGGDSNVIWWRAADAIARHLAGDEIDPMPVPALRVITEDNFSPDMYAPPNYESSYLEAWGVN